MCFKKVHTAGEYKDDRSQSVALEYTEARLKDLSLAFCAKYVIYKVTPTLRPHVKNQKNKKSLEPYGFKDFSGGRYRTRTCDPLHVKQVL